MKSLNGAEIADYMKSNQAHTTRRLQAQKIQPKLVILRDNDNPVITKYVKLKQRYGKDIGVAVEDWCRTNLAQAVREANEDPSVHGVILQLPIQEDVEIDELVKEINPKKDVDGLNPNGEFFESATATAINWLLAGYDIPLDKSEIAIVGRGRLVGAPLEKMWRNSGYKVKVFHKGDDLDELKDYDVVVSATGVPHLIKDEMIQAGATVVDAGTASEGGTLVGDVDKAVRERTDLRAITPKVGGVGPLTVTALFEHVLQAANRY